MLDVDTVNTLTFSPRLRERKLDIVLARADWPLDDPQLTDDLTIEPLLDDALVAVGRNHPLARRKTVEWRELEREQ
jgi:DNA-binding transcriptional LysR family regulator